MGKKKSFIERKNATTFRLVHRSQRDPLIADNEIGEHVLQPATAKDLEQRAKYGVYYTDNYDYLQHLKAVGEAVDVGKVDREVIKTSNATRNLPSVIFETEGIELKVGMLNKAAPTNELLPDVDPDIAAALEGDLDDTGSFSEFEDDFVLKLNAENNGSIEPHNVNPLKDESGGKSELLRRFGLTRERKFSDESSNDEDENVDVNSNCGNNVDTYDAESNERDESRSRFTNYSMSSAVIKRPDGLQIIDEHFETLYEQYDDEKCGGIDDEAELIAGHIEPGDERFQQLIRDYTLSKRVFVPEKPTEEMKDLALKYTENELKEASSNESETDEDEEDNQTRKRRWDCESILSTYSNAKNHPLVIKEMSSAKRRRHVYKDTKSILEKMDDTESVCTTTTITSIARSRGETAEERRMRKNAVREERRSRRVEKKMNKQAFKDQKKEFDHQRSTVHVDTRPIR